MAKDNLTGLHTDEYLKVELDNELARSRRFGRELALVLLEPLLPAEERADMGYTALKLAARAVGEATRQIDEGVRWGQQLVVMLPETTADGAQVAVEKIRSAFAAYRFVSPTTEQPFEVRLLDVVASYPQDAADKASLLATLRQRMAQQVSVASGATGPLSEEPEAS